jgi:hypothetical protein
MSVEKVCNLLDTECEPTDAELENLMKAVGDGVRARAAAANQRLRDTVRQETEDALDRWQASARK